MVIPLRRLTLRNTLLFGSASLLFILLLSSLTPLTAPLPSYTGPHSVGILDLETPITPRLIHNATLKETGAPAFELATLAVTLYYPTSVSGDASWERMWLPQPVGLIGKGYARLAGVGWWPMSSIFTAALWGLGSGVRIPGAVDTPVLGDESKVADTVDGGHDEDGDAKSEEHGGWEKDEHSELKRGAMVGKMPCVVFTHGMAGMSQSYSHYLGSIASYGYVVAAVEHRDGSGPGTIVHYPDGKEKTVWHMKLRDLESTPPMTALDLKAAQLAFRESEIREAITLFSHLNSDGLPINLKSASPPESLPGFKNRLNMSAVTIIGHSYGATGAIQALKSASTEAMPVNGGIALDPGKESGPLNSEVNVPVLVMQSGEWTEKQTEFYNQGKHFDVVRKIVANVKEGWFMTLTGTAHPSCTDAPLIVPWIMRAVTGTTLDARIALREYIATSVHFLEYLRNSAKQGMLSSDVTSADGPLGDVNKRGRAKGQYGAEWEVHVVPREV